MDLFIKQLGQGEPLILLHGWGFSGEIWHDIAIKLAQNWRVYQVDLPGHGRSAECEYNLLQLTKQLTNNLPKNAIWIGWSLGGLLAMAVARWQADWVRNLILVAATPRFITDKDWLHAMTPVVFDNFAQQVQNNRIATLQRFLALQVKGSTDSQQQLHHLNSLIKNNPVQISALQGGLTILKNTDLRSELQAISCPSLLCLGENDKIVPVGIDKGCQQWWGSGLKTIIIPSASHIPFLSHPDIFISHVKGFLNATDS